VVGVRQRRTRVAPEHLDGVRPRGLAHREISGAVADHHAFRRGDSETAHRVLSQVRCGLRARDRIATEVDVDVLLDAEPPQDPLAVRRALTRDRRLEQSCAVEIAQRRTGAAIQPRRRDRDRVVSRAVFHAVALHIVRADVRPREPEHGIERKADELADPVVRKQRTVVCGDDRVHGFDHEADAVGQRPVEIPEDRAEISPSGGDGALGRRLRARRRWAARSVPRRADRGPPGECARGTRARRRARRGPRCASRRS